MSETEVIGECVCMCTREHSPDLTEIIREGYGAVILEVPVDCMAKVGSVMFETVRLVPSPASSGNGSGDEKGNEDG